MQRGFSVLQTIIALGIMALLMMYAIPAYKLQTKKLVISEGMGLIQGFKVNIEDYFNNYGRLYSPLLHQQFPSFPKYPYTLTMRGGKYSITNLGGYSDNSLAYDGNWYQFGDEVNARGLWVEYKFAISPLKYDPDFSGTGRSSVEIYLIGKIQPNGYTTTPYGEQPSPMGGVQWSILCKRGTVVAELCPEIWNPNAHPLYYPEIPTSTLRPTDTW